MARLVAAFGSSHSIMLVSQREDWQHGFRAIDPKNAHYYDREGNKTDYDAVARRAAPPEPRRWSRPSRWASASTRRRLRWTSCASASSRAKLDVLLVVGDDQTELFRTTNNPTFAIY